MKRGLILLYAVVAYAVFFGAFLYAIGFTGGLFVPKGIDDGGRHGPAAAIVINLLLLSAFAVQHTIMARPAFKRWWTQLIPVHAERATFVLAASLLLWLLFWQWRPIPHPVWNLVGRPTGDLLFGLFAIGWLTVLVATFMIGHFALFGLWQAWLGFLGREIPSFQFITPGLYRVVRHPIMLGFLVAFWATPMMTCGHLLFTVVTTAYILFGIWIEERDLVSCFGERYLQYRATTPMLLPLPRRK